MSKAVYVRNREADGVIVVSIVAETGEVAEPTTLGPGESATVHIEEGEYLRIDDVTKQYIADQAAAGTESTPDPAEDEGSDRGDKAQVADDD